MRYRLYLRQRYRALLGYAGVLLGIIGILHFIPLLLLPFYPTEMRHAGSFIGVGVGLALLGLLAWRYLVPPEPLHLTLQEGSVVVVIVWVVAIAAGAVPFMAIKGLPFTLAVFEATSGWTAAGLTVVDVTQTPRLLLFFRSFTQVMGGAGFVIIALSAVVGSFSAGLVTAEGRTERLAPHIRHSANIVLTMYSSYILFGVVGLRLAGMGWFDAINHAFSAVSTGGFSTQPASIAHWDNPAVEAIIIVLMLLGSINFYVAFTLFSRKFRKALRSGELRLMAVLLVGASLILLALLGGLYPPDQAARAAVFETVSALSTTGFAIVSYAPWPDLAVAILILLMLIGGGTGSTAGAIKLMRVYILLKALVWEIRKAFMPPHMVNEPAIWEGDQRTLLSDQRVRQAAIFAMLYLLVFVAGSGILMALGYSLRDSLFETASALGGAGMSIGVTTPQTPAPALWLLVLGMFLGRLEFFTVIIGVIKLLDDGGTLLGLRRG